MKDSTDQATIDWLDEQAQSVFREWMDGLVDDEENIQSNSTTKNIIYNMF